MKILKRSMPWSVDFNFDVEGDIEDLADVLSMRFAPLDPVVIDGMIDTQAARQRFPERAATLGEEGMLAPDAIAETYYRIHAQARSAWTFETDLRPWAEKF